MEKRIQEVWQGWEVVKKIGSGGFGAVYEIRRDVFGRTESAALKVVSIPRSSDEIDELYNEGYTKESITQHYRTHLEEHIKEYSLMLDMKGHPNVVYCDDLRYEQHEDGIGWDIFIKMELLTPLTKILGSNFTEAEVVRLGKDICNALAACKKANIVHRDIKPQNIFVSRNGDYKLGDFGIAKISEKTQSGTKIGTFDYMPPEVYSGKPYGVAADIYSLGLVLHWLLNEKRIPFIYSTSEIPTGDEKMTARLRRLGGESIPAPTHGCPRLQQIVLKACAFRPEDRYASASEMLAELQSLDYTGAAYSENEDSDETVMLGGGSLGLSDTYGGISRSRSGVPAYDSGEITQKSETVQEKQKSGKAKIIALACGLLVVVLAACLLIRGCGDDGELSEYNKPGESSISAVSGEVSKHGESIENNIESGSSEIDSDHVHDFSRSWRYNESTHWHKCDCGEKSELEEHTLGEWTVVTAATEETEGKKERACSDCEYKETEVISVLDHTHVFSKTWQNDEASHWKDCECGEKSELSSHNFGEWKVITAATEETEGKKERTCPDCKYKESASVPVLAHKHSYSEAWQNNETAHWHECDCGEKTGLETHTFGEWTTVTAATEESEGKKERSCSICEYKETASIPVIAHEHSYSSRWKTNETTHWHECDCGDKLDFEGHDWDEWNITLTATETEEGTMERECAVCGYSEESTVPVLSHQHSYSGDWKTNETAHWLECDCGEKTNISTHSFGGWETTVSPTCVSEGSKKRVCSTCGYEEAASVPTTEHNLVTDPAVEATCGKDGLTEGKHCSVCGAVTVKQESIKSDNHSYKNGVCSVCGVAQTEGLEFEYTDSYCVVTGIGTCNDSRVYIPSEVNGLPVRAISHSAFVDCVNIIEVIIPDSVVTIEPSAFLGCTGLTSITIPDSVTYIQELAFGGCIGLKEVTISASVTRIGYGAFSDCTSLVEIHIPEKTNYIGHGAFFGCSSLKSVTFGIFSTWYIAPGEGEDGWMIDTSDVSEVAELFRTTDHNSCFYRE